MTTPSLPVTFNDLSDEIILYIFKFIANTAEVGPFGTCFENVFTLCQFRYISVRMSTILSPNVICVTLLYRDKDILRKKIVVEKKELGFISLSHCNTYYCVYKKDISHLVPINRRNPIYSRAGPMKLYPKLSVIACCIRKYGGYQNFMKYHLKKFQNQPTTRLIKTNSNNYAGILQLTYLPPPPPTTKTLRCKVKNCSAKNRLFCAQGLNDHKKAKHNVM